MDVEQSVKDSINFYMKRAYRKRSCEYQPRTGMPKVKYMYEEDAIIAVNLLHEQHPEQEFVHYKCSFCHNYHVGHRRS